MLWCGDCVLVCRECARERCRVEDCEGGGEGMRDSSPVRTLCLYLSCLAGSQVGLVMANTGNRREEVYEGDAEWKTVREEGRN